MRALYCKGIGGFNSVFINKSGIKGEVIYSLDNNKSNNKTKTSIHIGGGFHVEDDLGRYINHSCNPTSKICGRNIVLVKDVIPYSEITFDYRISEGELAASFKCNECGSLIKNRISKCLSGREE